MSNAETRLQAEIMLALSHAGTTVFRNNVGQARYPKQLCERCASCRCQHPSNMMVVAYGLAPGSSDIIGWRPLLITPSWIGAVVGQFVGVEVKTQTGRVSKSQRAFIDRVNADGGNALIARSVEDAVAGVEVNIP